MVSGTERCSSVVVLLIQHEVHMIFVLYDHSEETEGDRSNQALGAEQQLN